MTTQYLDIISDPDLGTIAAIRDGGPDGPIVTVSVEPVRPVHNHGDYPQAAYIVERQVVAEWAKDSPGWTDPSDR